MVTLFANAQSKSTAQLIQDDASLQKHGFRGGVRLDSQALGLEAPVYRYDSAPTNSQVPFRTDGSCDVSGIFPNGSLVHIIKKVQEQRFSPLLMADLFPINGEGGWNDYIEHYTETSNGIAKQICCAADFPRVEIGGSGFRTPSITFGSGFELCYSDIQKGNQAGIDLAARLMRTAMRAIQTAMNNYGLYGDTQASILGIANNPMLGYVGAPMPLDSPHSDPLHIAAMVKNAATNAYVTSSMANPPSDTLLIAPSLMQHWSTRYISNFPGSDTILGSILKDSTIKRVKEIPQFECMGPGGKRMALLYRLDSDCVEWRVPHRIEVLPPRDNGYGYTVNIIARINSLWFYYPEEVTRLVG